MNLFAARARYLSAIGAALPCVAMVACKDPPPPASAQGADGGSVASTATATTATAIATATETVSATATAPTGTAAPPILATAAQSRPLPSCPNGVYCVTEPAKVAASAAAAKPYAKCALTADEAGHTGGAFMAHARRVSFSPEDTKGARAKTSAACCYRWVVPCPGGRVFRDATGSPSVARTVPRGDWSAFAAVAAVAVADMAPSERASLAAHWTREAAFEHASIASFAQLTLDLLSAGAPPELLTATQRAALDEVEHARVAFALAAAYGGHAVGPAELSALPGACRSLATLAARTFIDACVGESVASAALAEDARLASDPALARLLERMAADEERHAELAWRIVAWAVKSGDDAVKRALYEAQTEVIAELSALASEAGSSPRHELRARVLREVVLPCSVALLTRAPPAPSTRVPTSLMS